MNEAIEGTFALDGLIEGKIPERADAKDLLHEWIEFAAKAKLKFSLELEGTSFSLLADNNPVQVAKLEAPPDEAVANALTELLRIFPADERPPPRASSPSERSFASRPSGWSSPCSCSRSRRSSWITGRQ